METICGSALGYTLEVQSNKNVAFLNALIQLSRIIVTRMISPWYYPKSIYKLSPAYREEMSYRKCMYDVYTKVNHFKSGKKQFFK